ncbi:MAG TPA: amino acid adenylation domain-containing protein, partial [Longimicrobium sp.]|nr:amino acid adenylation domain-containing protein [Longimicrobium sp.]
AFEHQEMPFERLVAELQPERSLGHSPLFQVMFTADAAPPVEAAPLLDARALPVETDTAQFDLTLRISHTGDGLHAAVTYATDLFERGTVRRMLAHLARVLEQVADDADVRLSRLRLLDAAERRTMVEDWNRTDAVYPADRGIAALFQAQAAAAPDALAVAGDGAPLPYRALNERANRLAHHLVRRGVSPEARVGICLERGTEMVVAMLAVLKAGGAYVPLDPGLPAERLAFMVADSGAAVLVTRAGLRGVLPDAPVVCVDADGERIAAERTDDPATAAGPGSLAYLIYTSGSTGTPKGVAVEHRGVVRLVRGTDYVDLGPADRVAQASTAAFDAATFEIWGALLNGGAVVVVARDVALLPADLAAAIRAHGITTLFLTTALFNQVARELPGAFAPLRTLLFGGEAVDPGAVRRVLDAGGPARLLHVYGPTENTTFSSWHPVQAVPAGAQTVPIGRAVAHSTAFVLDGGGQPVPAGVPGELFLGGDGVARGYLGRPALTAQRFVPDPFAARPGARMYRTGDRVRWTAEGALEFVGRLDDQVKIRGLRIEPGEVESVLAAHPAVREARVVVREDVPGEKRLVAYVVGDVHGDALRAHLRRGLPDYMVPAAFVSMDHLPLTPNGKLDARALPAPDPAVAGDGFVAPRTPAEEVLAGICADVLRLERVGVEDDFFALGGHSLLATRVVSRIRAVFGVELPLRALFEGPTVARLADAVEEVRRVGAPLPSPVVPADRGRPLPLSFAQERLWFLDRLRPGGTTYNMYVPLRLAGLLDVGALEHALAEIVRRHEALRTTFREVDGTPVQVIAPAGGFALAMAELSDLGPAECEAEVRLRAAKEAARPFDLAAGPLFRAALLRISPDDHVLLLGMHHAVSDGWSLGVLFRELSVLYGAFHEHRPSPLAPLGVQYADYAVWQRRRLAGALLEGQLAYWRERLAGAPALLELPTDHARPAVQAYRGAHVPVDLSPALMERLQALGRGEGATLFMVLAGAFQVLLGKYAGSDDVVLGTAVAGRGRGETEELIGFFVNTLALRTDLSGDPDFRGVLGRVREATLGAYEHQEVPFEKLVAELHPDRSLSHAPLFQVMFTMEDAGSPRPGIPGLRTGPVAADDEVAKFDLTLGMAATPEGLRGGLTYRTDLWEHATVERMVQHLERVLEQVAADPGRRLSELELSRADERRLVVEAWNRTGAPYPLDRCVPDLFREQAARTPDAPAVAHGGRSLTYRELDAATNRLARWLRGRGVGPDAPVAVCLEPGTEFVVALLAVLKAGGAYVALDPAQPAERLAYMLADSRAAVLLTQGSLRGVFGAHDGVQAVSVDAQWPEIAAKSAAPLPGAAGPRNVAYVIYTSGSTGRPKGAAVEHRNLANLCAWHAAWFGTGPADRVAQIVSPGFDVSVYEIWPALAHGACLDVAPAEIRTDPVRLRDWIVGRALTQAFVPTPMAEPLLALEWPAAAPLRWLFAGGDRLLVRPRPGATFALGNAYGPTECTVVSTFARVEPRGARPPSIGTPVPNTRCYVLDAGMRPLPAGVPGELLLGGAQLARGYLHRPGLTAERFVPDPFAAEPGGRLYRTGDRARWMADGTLECLGRLDEQVKIRGFRIELGEIEASLRRHDGVADCAVLAREDAPGQRRLVAYVVGGADAGALRVHLRRELPEYMVPAAFVALDALPLTPGGKLDRKALPAPAPAAAGTPGVAPETGMEARVAAVWREVLGVDEVGVEDNFFDLGGHSLLLMKLQGRLAAELGREVPVVELFEYPTVRALAARLQDGGAGTAAAEEGGERGGARQAGANRLAGRRGLAGRPG